MIKKILFLFVLFSDVESETTKERLNYFLQSAKVKKLNINDANNILGEPAILHQNRFYYFFYLKSKIRKITLEVNNNNEIDTIIDTMLPKKQILYLHHKKAKIISRNRFINEFYLSLDNILFSSSRENHFEKKEQELNNYQKASKDINLFEL